jgi:hypothetical protein
LVFFCRNYEFYDSSEIATIQANIQAKYFGPYATLCDLKHDSTSTIQANIQAKYFRGRGRAGGLGDENGRRGGAKVDLGWVGSR